MDIRRKESLDSLHAPRQDSIFRVENLAYAIYTWNSSQVLVYLWLTKKKFSHQACDIGSQPGLCGMVELHTASNAKYIGMTQTIVEPRRENSSILILVRHTGALINSTADSMQFLYARLNTDSAQPTR